MNDEQMTYLVKEASNGSREAFEALYSIYVTPIYRFILFRVRRMEDAEDLTQTVFVKAFRGVPALKDKNYAFKSWLYTIARNTVTDYWRKKKDVLIENEFDYFSAIKDDSLNQAGRAINSESIAEIFVHIKRLSRDQQEVISLRFIRDLTTSEIAQIMKRNEDAVRSLQYRAIKELRKNVKKYYEK